MSPVLVTVKPSGEGVEIRTFNGQSWTAVWLDAMAALTLADDITRLAEQKVERDLR